MTVSLKAMAYFTTAVRHGNIAKAAAELNIAASAVAAAIDQIEDAFDLTLVTRQRSRGIQPNANGRAIARKCERLLEEHRSLMAEGADLRQALHGTLRIGYYAPVAPAFLPQVLASFVPSSGDVDIHLDECDNDKAQDGLLDGTYDVILFVSDRVRPALDFDVLTEAPPYCLLPPTHDLARNASVSLGELASEPMVVLNRPLATAYYQNLLKMRGQDAAIVAYATSTEMVRSLVGAGHGCAILNMVPLTRQTYCGAEVVALPIYDPLPPLTLSLGYDKTRPRRLVRHFVSACKAAFADDAEHRFIVG
ncbi:LysR family transcriptional regulator [Thalassococcus sp. S3]|uniref:LysR family transcriptional regulator n=1 Tax=Thalassococcus sp. S3 TaxID=2017482 RepID=UPI0010245591|nr:LysR family transcriptional regulator [Thalassococcus sp. S3]QBF34015.1 LysR family transcriptional regulator [Thalassococcus sp. S3]